MMSTKFSDFLTLSPCPHMEQIYTTKIHGASLTTSGFPLPTHPSDADIITGRSPGSALPREVKVGMSGGGTRILPTGQNFPTSGQLDLIGLGP